MVEFKFDELVKMLKDSVKEYKNIEEIKRIADNLQLTVLVDRQSNTDSFVTENINKGTTEGTVSEYVRVRVTDGESTSISKTIVSMKASGNAMTKEDIARQKTIAIIKTLQHLECETEQDNG